VSNSIIILWWKCVASSDIHACIPISHKKLRTMSEACLRRSSKYNIRHSCQQMIHSTFTVSSQQQLSLVSDTVAYHFGSLECQLQKMTNWQYQHIRLEQAVGWWMGVIWGLNTLNFESPLIHLNTNPGVLTKAPSCLQFCLWSWKLLLKMLFPDFTVSVHTSPPTGVWRWRLSLWFFDDSL